MATYPLNDGRDGTVPASGTVLVTLDVPTLEAWTVTRIAVLASSNTLEPTARVYVDSESARSFLDGTFTGSNDSSDCYSLRLRPGQKLLCRWTGADVGATVTLSVFGEKTSPPGRS